MFLVNVHEALGLTYEETLNSSYALIQSMLAEYWYVWNERNKDEDESGEFEWVELPDWDDPTKTNRVKKYKDIQGLIQIEKNL